MPLSNNTHESCPLPRIHEIAYNDITVADELLCGYNEERCKNALWSAYNVLKKMKDAGAPKNRYYAIYVICAHASYDAVTGSLIYSGKTNRDFNDSFPVPDSCYAIQEYDFVLFDFVYPGEKKPKKIELGKLKQFSLSYKGTDFVDAILGLKILGVASAKHSWPFFVFADIRVAFKNAAELGLPLGKTDKPHTVEELCGYLLTDSILQEGAGKLLALSHTHKMRNRRMSFNSYTFTYKGENVMNLTLRATLSNKGINEKEEMNHLHVLLNIGQKEDAETLLSMLPGYVQAEFIKPPIITSCGWCTHCHNYLVYNDVGLCTINFSYSRYNPTAGQFKIIEEIIETRVTYIDKQKAVKKVSVQEKTPKKPAKKKPAPHIHGEVSIYEQTNAKQRLVKPLIEGCVDHFVTDSTLRNTVLSLVEVCRDYGMEPAWRSKNRYDSRYKKYDMLKFRIEGDNNFCVSVFDQMWREWHETIKDYICALPDEKKQRYVSLKQPHCHNCRESCIFVLNINLSGKKYILCARPQLIFTNPGPKDIKNIRMLVDIMMDYVDAKE